MFQDIHQDHRKHTQFSQMSGTCMSKVPFFITFLFFLFRLHFSDFLYYANKYFYSSKAIRYGIKGRKVYFIFNFLQFSHFDFDPFFELFFSSSTSHFTTLSTHTHTYILLPFLPKFIHIPQRYSTSLISYPHTSTPITLPYHTTILTSSPNLTFESYHSATRLFRPLLTKPFSFSFRSPSNSIKVNI